MLTITNDFHDTEYRTRRSAEEIERMVNTPRYMWTRAEKQFARRCWNTLCGSEECTCGGPLGERGPQEWERELYQGDE